MIFIIIMNFVGCNGIPFLGGRQIIIAGTSMEPGLRDGDKVIINPVDRELERGYIILYTLADSNDFLKRIIGLPGETIETKNGQVYIDGIQLEEPYLKEQGQTFIDDPLLILQNHYFVMGDNRNSSFDSRMHGPVVKDGITGISNK